MGELRRQGLSLTCTGKHSIRRLPAPAASPSPGGGGTCLHVAAELGLAVVPQRVHLGGCGHMGGGRGGWSALSGWAALVRAAGACTQACCLPIRACSRALPARFPSPPSPARQGARRTGAAAQHVYARLLEGGHPRLARVVRHLAAQERGQGAAAARPSGRDCGRPARDSEGRQASGHAGRQPAAPCCCRLRRRRSAAGPGPRTVRLRM